jgi:phosphate transport system permease protein
MESSQETRRKVEAGLVRRRRREALFQGAGVLATTVGIVFLGVFFADLFAKGSSAFVQTFMKLDVEFSEDVIAPGGELDLAYADFDGLVRTALRTEFPEVSSRGARRALYKLTSIGAGYQMRDMIEADRDLLGTRQSIWVPASSTVDMFVKGNIDASTAEALRPLSDAQIAWVQHLEDAGRLKLMINSALFSNGDSREPELAGIKGALMGSFYMLIVTVLLAFPIGVARACCVHQLDRDTTFRSARWRVGAVVADLTGNHHCVSRGDKGGSAVNS